MWVLFYPKFRDLKDVLRIQSNIYHIVGKNGKMANLKTGFSRKQSMPNFPKSEQFLPPWYAHVRVFASANSLEIITSFEMSFKKIIMRVVYFTRFAKFLLFQKKRRFQISVWLFYFHKPLLNHRVKIIQILSFFWFVFSCVWTGYGDLISPNTRKYGPEKSSYLDTFHAACYFHVNLFFFDWSD